ncbi:MAG: trehalose/maltose transport system substrate-binding protein [Thermomicrobiales bacterium]|jgi:multiple sugar transport system substrate-binding protein|nr:trehalose/maltose transport system substrate-binding protein [Thermomicrobiales bacterium]
MTTREQVRERRELMQAALGGRLTRRDVMKRGAALGLAGSALAGYGALAPRLAGAQTPSGKLLSWAPSGQRWELPQRAVYELFKQKFPDIEIEWVAEPIADYIPRTVIEMSAKSDKYDILHNDYQVVPQLIALGSLEPIDPYLDRDPEFKADLLADVPENVMDLYRDKPLAQGGALYGLPPDSNCQLQYYRADIFEQAGVKPAETWEDAVAIAGELNKQTGTTLKRGLFAGTVFITILRCYGGDWFDKMEKGAFNPTLNTEAGASALDIIVKLKPSLEDSSLNASDDESNPAMANGTWTYAPVQWGGTTMNDPNFTEFADVWKQAPVPAGGANGKHAPHMGGLGLVIPAFSKNKDAAWEFVKFCGSGNKQDPAIGKAWVEGTGQPARASLLQEYSSVRAHFPALQQSMPTAVRYPPLPETAALYEAVGTEVAAVVTGEKDAEGALKDMEAAVKQIMSDAGYYS